jgi:antitoxin PrlF
MHQSTITSKGQTTVPQPIREALHAQAGTPLNWHLTSDGTIIVRAKNKSFLEMGGMLSTPNQKRVSIAEMNPWR